MGDAARWRWLRAGAVTKSPQVSSRYPQITEVSLDVVELPQVDEGGARLRNRNLARRGATGYAHSAGPAPQPEPPRSWSAWVLRSVGSVACIAVERSSGTSDAWCQNI